MDREFRQKENFVRGARQLSADLEIKRLSAMRRGKPVRRVIRAGGDYILCVAPAGRPCTHHVSNWRAIGIGHDHDGPIGGVKIFPVDD